MFSRPIRGWSDVTIEDFKCDGSYLTDIPHDVLCSAKSALENDIPFVLYLDEERNEVFIFSYYERTYVIRQIEPPELHVFEIDFRDLLAEIMQDFSDFIYDWSAWAEYELTDDEIDENKVKIEAQIAEIRELIKQKTNPYDKDSFD